MYYNYGYKKQSKFKNLLSQKDKKTRDKWIKEQNELKKKLIDVDDHNWVIDSEKKDKEEKDEPNSKKDDNKNSINIINEEEKKDKKEKDGPNTKKDDNKNSINIINEEEKKDEKEKLRYIAGVDISFDKYDKNVGISGLVVCDAEEDFKIVYDDYRLIKIEEPYIPSFLAFREVNPYVDLINDLKKNKPEFVPQVILVDGNGILHTRGFGIASHLGVLVDLPTIGVAKTVFALKDEGITDDYVKEMYHENMFKFGDSFALVGYSDKKWGYALRSTDYYDDPIIVSIGHKVSNETALEVTKMCCYYKEPEPIRLADKITRRLIKAYQNFVYNNPKKKWDIKRYYTEKYDYLHSKLY
jgi:deoxyinosine 3'endonuclease (endonuclease V)